MITIAGQQLAFEPSQVVTGILADNPEDAIRPLSERLVAAGLVEDDFLQHVVRREASFPTGLPTEPVGVAVPHTDAVHVRSSAIAVGILEHPIDFGVMGAGDDEKTPVSIIFLLAIAQGTKHMNVLGSLTRLFRKPEFLEEMAGADAGWIHQTLSAHLGDHAETK